MSDTDKSERREIYALAMAHAAISAGETYSADLAVQRADDLVAALAKVPPPA